MSFGASKDDGARIAASPDPLHSPVAGVTLRMVTLANTGTTLRVACCGQASGQPVLLMHGFPESWFSWRHQLQALGEAGYWAIAPDMRGYGWSDAPSAASAYSVHHIAADMVGLIQELGLRRVALVGHDWGAALTWLLGLLLPEHFPILAAMSVPTTLRKPGAGSPVQTYNKVFGEGPDRRFWYQAYHQETFPGSSDYGPAEAEYDSNISESILRFWTDKSVPTTQLGRPVSSLRRDGGMFAHQSGRPDRLPSWLSRGEFEYVVEQFKRHGFHGGVCYYRNLHGNHATTPQLVGKKIEQPCLFITGEDDPVVQFAPGGLDRQRVALQKVCSDLRQFVVLRCEPRDGRRTAGHWIQQERPAEVNEHLLHFLNSCWKQPNIEAKL